MQVQGLAFFLPRIIAILYPGPVVSQQLRTVPPYIVGAFFTVLLPLVSWRLDRRTILFIAAAPLMMVGYIMFLASRNVSVRYAATFLITSGAFAFGALCNAHAAANVVSDTAKATAISTVVMAGNVGGLSKHEYAHLCHCADLSQVSTWAFLPWDAPNYFIGNGLNLATSTAILLLGTTLLFWMKWNNTRRDRMDVDTELEGKDQHSIADLDWKHPAFRWRA